MALSAQARCVSRYSIHLGAHDYDLLRLCLEAQAQVGRHHRHLRRKRIILNHFQIQRHLSRKIGEPQQQLQGV